MNRWLRDFLDEYGHVLNGLLLWLLITAVMLAVTKITEWLG